MQNPYDPPETPAGEPDSPVPFIPDQPLPLRALIGLSWRVFRGALPQIVIITCVIHAPLEILLKAKDFQFDLSMSRNSMTGFRIIQLFDFLFGVIATMAIASLVDQATAGPVKLGRAARLALSRWGHALATNLRGGLVVFGLLLLGIIPGIIWSLYYAYSSYIVATRGMSGHYALDYSKSLVKGRWWRTLGFLTAFLVIALVPGMVMGFLIGILEELALPHSSPAKAAIDVVSALITDTGLAFFTVQAVVLFFNVEKVHRSRVRATATPEG